MRETTVFFRDDDVGNFSDSLRRVMNVLLEAEIPCHYQVVPKFLDDESAGELRKLQEANPQLIFLNQHGLKHSQELGGQLRDSEFAGHRLYSDQYRDIEQGRNILRQMLGESFCSRIFTPPCHKFDAETVRALGDLGFELISAGVRTDFPSRVYYFFGRKLRRISFFGKRVSYHRRRTPDPRLAEVSVSIDVHEAVDSTNNRIEKSAESLWREFSYLRSQLGTIGVMLHHEACDTPEKVVELKTFVQKMVDDPSVRFATLYELSPIRSEVTVERS